MSATRWPVRPAAVVLDLLAGDERTVAERLLVDDPNFRAEVERLRSTATALAGLEGAAWQPEAPPSLEVERRPAPADRREEPRAAGRHRTAAVARTPRRRAAVLAAAGPQLARHRAAVLAAAGPRLARRRLAAALPRGRRPLAVLAAAAALLLVLAVGAALLARGGGGEPAAPSTTLTLRALPGVRGQARLTIAGADAELRGSGLRPSGAHDYYEAWLADAAGRMVSMGTFRVGPDGRVDAHMPVAVDVARYALVDVSLEPDDGDPAHSDRSVLRARL